MIIKLAAIIFATHMSTALAAKNVVNTEVKLTCPTLDFNLQGGKPKASEAETITIEIKRINWAKDPNAPPEWGSMSNIKVISNGVPYEASLIRSTRDEIAFTLSDDSATDGRGRTLAFIYEVTLGNLQLKRTLISLFSKASTSNLTSTSNCKR